MGIGYTFKLKSKPHFMVLTVTNGIDVFSQQTYKDAMMEILNYCSERRGLNLHAWSIMSNRVNLIISSKDGFKLDAVINDLKRYTSRILMVSIQSNLKEDRKSWMLWMFKWDTAKRATGDNTQFWETGIQLTELSNNEILERKLTYLHQNPVIEGIVWQASHYRYSSAINYYEAKPGLLPVNVLSPLSFSEVNSGLKKAV